MGMIVDFLQQLMNACFQLLGQPFYYIGILFVILQYRRQMALERKMFHSKLHSYLNETWRTLLWGILAGFITSLIMALFGTVLQMEAVIMIWIAALLLTLIRVRFLCFAYAIGIIGMLQAIIHYFPIAFFDTLLEINMSSLLLLVAILHFIEALFIRWNKTHSEHPLFMEGKRGRLVGGYQIQGLWPVPLFLVVPVDSGSGLHLALTPLFGGDVWSNGWMLFAFPVVIGYSTITKTMLSRDKAKWSSQYLLLYSLIMMILAFGVEWFQPLTFAASLLCILLHEALIWIGAWKETQQSPYYTHDDRGLLILGTISGSAAEEMGIQAGEIIRQVNGMQVKTKAQLHEAFRLNPAFYKLEIINLEGNSKFLKRAMFSDEHYQLGLILAPDQDAEYYLNMKQNSIFSYFGMKFSGLLQKPTNHL